MTGAFGLDPRRDWFIGFALLAWARYLLVRG